MRHDWIFDVLTDLRSYAEQNDLQALAAQVEMALAIAHAEIGAAMCPASQRKEDEGNTNLPVSKRAH
jgi:hypothetical protein